MSGDDIDARTLVKTVETEHLGDVWLGWVERHHGLARSAMVQVAGGKWQVTAYLPESRGDEPATGDDEHDQEGFDELVATARSPRVEELEVQDLVTLLGRLHEAREQISSLEDRVLVQAHEQGAVLRTLSTALGSGSPEGVRKRLSRLNGSR